MHHRSRSMNDESLVRRPRRRVMAAAAVAIASAALGAAAASQETAVVAILHPMQPIGNIDCCH